jgi:uncharacterized membrane protein
MAFSTLDSPLRWLFLVHALAGGLALAVFAIPLISKKGARLHTRVGWVYTGAMGVVGVSALVITPWRLFFDPSRTQSSENFALFLFYISIFTLAAIAYGLFSLKEKNRTGASRSFLHLAPPLTTLVFGLVVQGVGLQSGDILLVFFPFIGHANSISQLRYWLRAPRESRHWWYAHMQGMFVACISTITAFLVTAVPRIWPGPFAESILLWIAPGVILGTLLNFWTSFYRKKFETKSSA